MVLIGTSSTRRLFAMAALVLAPLAPGLLAFPLLATSHPVRAAAVEPSSPLGISPSLQAGTNAAAAPEPAPPVDAAAGQPEGEAQQAMRFLPPPKPGELWVAVSITEQRVRVYQGRGLVRDMIASTGRPDTPTPRGTFQIQNRGYWFFSPRFQQGGYYWVSFKDWGVYLFHSVPADANGAFIPEEAERLGEPASHGCVRLSLEDARWFYENIPQGTRVEIF